GSQLQRVERLQKLAGEIARRLGANVAQAERAAYLCKADLLTDMVGEFPELQGIMGRYYALHDGEPAAVADAIQNHYLPRGGGDNLPQDSIAISVALAEKLDMLVGIYGIGLVPTGDKDPFGLRRAALGVLRILIENKLPLDVHDLLNLAKGTFPRDVLADSVTVGLHGFMLERLKNYLREKDFAPDEIDAVISQNPTRMDAVLARVEAVRAFGAMPESVSLAAANKRIRNILKKAEAANGAVNASLIADAAEKNLFDAMRKLSPQVSAHMQNQHYTGALKELAGVRGEVDKFFEDVMVMHQDPAVRNNRIALLRELDGLMNQVADISKLAAS
ncbi:MAG: glycine--tRNA ligase subunit beta, partial [Burkholderiales bacterium]